MTARGWAATLCCEEETSRWMKEPRLLTQAAAPSGPHGTEKQAALFLTLQLLLVS